MGMGLGMDWHDGMGTCARQGWSLASTGRAGHERCTGRSRTHHDDARSVVRAVQVGVGLGEALDLLGGAPVEDAAVLASAVPCTAACVSV